MAELLPGLDEHEYLPELSQYFTPVKLASMMAMWAGIRLGMRVLEPSAGCGRLVTAIEDAGAWCHAVEIDDRWADTLEKNHPDAVVTNGDFLRCTIDSGSAVGGSPGPWAPYINLALMNPPLNGGVGLVHVAHALRFAPRAVSLLRTADLHGAKRYRDFWSKYDLHRIAYLVHRPDFGGEHSAMADFVCVDVRRPDDTSDQQTIEHWLQRWK